MVQANLQWMTFEEFLVWQPDNQRYELHDGLPVEMQPKGKHEEIIEFLTTELTLQARQSKQSWRFFRQALVKIPNKHTGYLPDLLVVDGNAIENEPLWERASTLTQGTSIPLVVEVVSHNWRDDYGYKLTDYETLGISEYWIVDYLALGGRRYIGFPKQPTISIYRLLEEEYQLQQFRNNELIQSLTFPNLQLTANQIFQATL